MATRCDARAFALALLMFLAACAGGNPRSASPEPVRYDLRGPTGPEVPSIVVLTGAGQPAASLIRQADFAIDGEGWAVVSANPSPGGWMAPLGDVTLDALLKELREHRLVDPARIFLVGYSDGGQRALLRLCGAADVAAVAAVKASLPKGAGCPEGRPVPALLFNSVADPLLPFVGGKVRRNGEAHLPVRISLFSPVMAAEQTAAILSRRNGCGAAREVPLPDLAPDDGSRVVQRVYDGCAAPTRQFVIEGGGHGWPGTRLNAATASVLGQPSRDVFATMEIEAFAREVVAR